MLNIVLITAGIDHLSARFHKLPGKPVAIIEYDDWDAHQTIRYFLRKAVRYIWPDRYPDCEAYCRKHGFEYIKVKKSKGGTIGGILERYDTNLAITYNCPLIPSESLGYTSHGEINLHDSLLPDYRGGNPLFWQVINNEDEIGCTVHYLTNRMDDGEILEQKRVSRPKNIHHKELSYFINVQHGFPVLVSAINKISTGNRSSKKQSRKNIFRKAPNCDWSTWREIVGESMLTEAHNHDVNCFLGDVVKPNIPKLII